MERDDASSEGEHVVVDGLALHVLARAAGLRHWQVAERAGITPNRLSLAVARGRVLPVDVVGRLARIFGVPVDALVRPPHEGVAP